MFVTETKLGETLQKVQLLNESQAWIESITPELQQEYIEKWIKGDQLFSKGVDEDGALLGTYSLTTQIMSKGRKKAGTHYTLLDSGQFYQSIYIKVMSDSLIVDGDFDDMTNERWFNENNLDEDKILGLIDENFEKFTKEIAINYAAYVRRILGVN
jgi:hypothetical protein